MDLKLYKQIEQKSRQDLKALRDWGLPEPDNEHELWEKLRNSDLVVNNPIPSRELGCMDELFEPEPSSLLESESFRCFDESSEPESALGGNEDSSNISNRSHSEEVAFLSECEESMESVPNEDNPDFSSHQNHHYMSALEFHANRNNTGNNAMSPINSIISAYPIVEHEACNFSDEEVNPVNSKPVQVIILQFK